MLIISKFFVENSVRTQFDSSAVESDHVVLLHSVDLSRSGVSHSSNLPSPNKDDNAIMPDIDVFVTKNVKKKLY